jgi:hypothetical protein
MSRSVKRWKHMPTMRRIPFAGQKAYSHARDDLQACCIIIPRYDKPVAWDDVYARSRHEMPKAIWNLAKPQQKLWMNKRHRPNRTWRRSIKKCASNLF